MSVGSHTVIVASNAPRAKPVPARAHRRNHRQKKEGQDTPGHSDSPRFDFPGVILLKNPSGTGNEAIGQQYWARIIVFAGTFPSTPRFLSESSVTASGSGLDEAFEISSPQARKPREGRRVMRA
jgi:hypothetical protein